DINGDTPLHILAQQGDSKAVKWLVTRTQSIYTKNYIGLMPIQMTRSGKVYKLLEQLMIPHDDRLGPSDFHIL
ncbi:MAG: hypothetical protein V2I33_16835, partial [Kangiellaceae bacterium]|nr:hypothetical protein [Kangiellaceae bacterium]